MSEVDPNHAPTLHIHHVVGEVTIPYTQHVLTHGHRGPRAQEVIAEGEKCFRGGGQGHEGTSEEVPRYTRHLTTKFLLNVSFGCFPGAGCVWCGVVCEFVCVGWGGGGGGGGGGGVMRSNSLL